MTENANAQAAMRSVSGAGKTGYGIVIPVALFVAYQALLLLSLDSAQSVRNREADPYCSGKQVKPAL